jgi:hypothetical protein
MGSSSAARRLGFEILCDGTLEIAVAAANAAFCAIKERNRASRADAKAGATVEQKPYVAQAVVVVLVEREPSSPSAMRASRQALARAP